MKKPRWRPLALALASALSLGLPLGSQALDVHLQQLSPAPGLNPTEPLGALDGLTEAINCGLDFLNTAKACGLSAPSEAATPFAVRFDPMFCRLTMRFSVGEMIDGMLKKWLAGAFARSDTPMIGALCLLGIGAQYCPAGSSSSATSLVLPASNWPKAAAARSNDGQERRAIQEALQKATGPAGVSTPAATTATPPAETAKSATEEKRDGATGLDTLLR